MFEIRTEEQIKRDMLGGINKELDKSEKSFIHDVISSAAIEFAQAWIGMNVIAGELDVENLEGDELTRFAYQRTGVERKPATKATETVIISGSEGAKISKGDLVGTETVNFISLEEKTIGESGFIEVLVECEQFGPVGNVPAGTINSFPVSISGIIEVYNPEPVTNGYDEEPDKDLRQRYYYKLQRPGKSGNKYHYLEWALEVIGVGDARVFPRWDGPLTVKVVIIDSNKQPAESDLEQSVLDHIEEERPFGADVTVISADELTINVAVELVIDNNYTPEQVEDNIKQNITAYLAEVAFKDDYISFAKIGNAILNSTGVLDYSGLLINGGTANIPVGEEEVAILGTVTNI